ncbi:MAG: fibronectin type III domain-containing protein [Promethearchaeota archaeon]
MQIFSKLRKITVCYFVLLLALSIVGLVASSEVPVSRIPTPGIGIYAEDFESTAFLMTADAYGWGLGAVTSDRVITNTLLDTYSSVGPVMGLDTQGRKIYFISYGSSSNSNNILNVTDPANLQLMSARTSVSDLRCARIDGDIFYAGRTSGLAIYNVSNPYNYGGTGVYLGTTGLDGVVTDIDTQGHFVYCTARGSAAFRAFKIIDVEDPYNPQEITNNWGSQTTLGIDVEGQLVYLAEDFYGLYIANISNPHIFLQYDHFDTPGNATDVLVEGSLAYVADGPSGIHIVDVSDPTAISVLGSCNTPGNARRLALQGKTLFVADEDGGVRVIDVSDPTHPTNVTSLTAPIAYDVALYGGILVVGTNLGVQTFKIGNFVSTLAPQGIYSGGYEFWDVKVQGDIAYIAAGEDGLVALDVSNPAAPVFLDSHVTGSNRFYRKLDIQGHLAVVADYGSGGARIYDISDPTNLHYISTYGLGWATDIAIYGEVIFVADGAAGIYLANISTPSTPVGIDSYDLGTSNVTGLAVQGHFLYAVSTTTSSDDIVTVFDITDLSNIQPLGTYVDTFTHYDVYIDGDYGLATELMNAPIWNFTDPTSITTTDVINGVVGECLGCWGFGPYALFANGSAGLMLVNATNLHNMQVLDCYLAASGAIQVTVHGDYIYLANKTSLIIFRLFDSTGATYVTGSSMAQSSAIYSSANFVYEATLEATTFIPPGTNIEFHMTADGGSNWESVTPGVLHNFAHLGPELHWRAIFTTSRNDQSAHLYNITFSYTWTVRPTTPVLDDPGDSSPSGDITVSWSASTDSDGSIDHYELQMSDSASFTTILDTFTTTYTNYNITGLVPSTYYFRVRAIDNNGAWSNWSSDESIAIIVLPPPIIPGFPIATIIIGLCVALGLTVLIRRRKR